MNQELFTELDEALADLTASKNKTGANKPADEGQLTVDVYQNNNEIVIQSTIGGIDGKDIDISIAKDMVTIKGVRAKTEKVKQSDYFHQEVYWGSFSRSVILPVDIDVDKAKASIKNGLLTVRLPILQNK
ncbi:MAG: Hsp20/alpha crystallin family protein [Candidatus Yanofskybacteria bacterium]|nr:Hsp20/alpha crystallin family protein [Candidatus Yanofskybacteria bacterium]